MNRVSVLPLGHFAATFAMALLAVPVAFTQTPPTADSAASAVIRTESRLVLVDAAVRDDKGAFLRGLEAKDFRIWEDGKEQKVLSLTVESQGRNADQAQKQCIVLFFDGLTVTASEAAALRREIAAFVEAYAAPDRYMAVVNFATTLSVLQNFTSSPELLKKAVASTLAPGLASLSGLMVPRGTSAIDSGNLGTPAPGSTDVSNLLYAIRETADSLAYVRGRKTLVFLSAGIVQPDARDLGLVIQACNRANVAIYSVDARRLRSAPQTLLGALAQGTGGRMIVSNDLIGRLGAALAEQSEYYMVGYTPPETPEGSCHQIRVEASGASEVLARKSYCSVKPRDVLAATATALSLNERVAGAAPAPAETSMQLPFFYRSANLARARLAADIPTAALKFSKVNGKQHAELYLVGAVLKGNGQEAARFTDIVKLDFDSEKEARKSATFRYENQFDVAAGEYVFRLSFGSGESFSKLEAPLRVGPWNAGTLALSGIAFGADVRKTPDLTGDLEAALLEESRPLMFRSMQISPSGHATCLRNEQCLAYFEIYAPPPPGDQPPTLTVQVNLLDAKTGEPKRIAEPFDLADLVRPGNPTIPFALALPVKGLSAGAYLVEVVAERAGGETALRTSPLVLK